MASRQRFVFPFSNLGSTKPPLGWSRKTFISCKAGEGAGPVSIKLPRHSVYHAYPDLGRVSEADFTSRPRPAFDIKRPGRAQATAADMSHPLAVQLVRRLTGGLAPGASYVAGAGESRRAELPFQITPSPQLVRPITRPLLF